VVNHSTYHRGQASTILRQLGAAAPETDFVVFREAVRESAAWPSALVLPGLYDSGPGHWQSQWEALHLGFVRVVQEDWIAPRIGDWVETLDRAIARTTDAPVLVAHSAACALVAHWAARTERRVKGALLVAPADPEAASFPAGPSGFAPLPIARLAFPSIVVASRDDPYVSIARARRFAQSWGSRFVDAGEAGHLNSDSGLRAWPSGFALLRELRGS
jgi:predicted alpha/beta hydrolase family esterase